MRGLGFSLLVLGAMVASACGGSDGPAETPASEMLDQSAMGPFTATAGIGDIDRAQSFTVGLAGTLTRVELWISRNGAATGTIRIDVRPTAGGRPVEDDNAALGSVDVDVTTLPASADFVSFDLSPANIAVTPGQVLAIVARRFAGGGGGTVAILPLAAGIYADGQAHLRQPAGTWSAGGGSDAAFRTFVLP